MICVMRYVCYCWSRALQGNFLRAKPKPIARISDKRETRRRRRRGSGDRTGSIGDVGLLRSVTSHYHARRTCPENRLWRSRFSIACDMIASYAIAHRPCVRKTPCASWKLCQRSGHPRERSLRWSRHFISQSV